MSSIFSLEGMGDSIIQDVSYKLHQAIISADAAENATEKQQVNKARLQELRQQVAELYEEQNRLKADQQLLDGYSRHYTRNQGDKCTSIPDILHGGSLDAFQRFRAYYNEANRDLSQSILKNKQKLAEAKSLLEGLEKTLSEGIENNSNVTTTANRVEESTQVTVIIDAEEDTLFDLTLSYGR
jgi:archaellum component FlaC